MKQSGMFVSKAASRRREHTKRAGDEGSDYFLESGDELEDSFDEVDIEMSSGGLPPSVSIVYTVNLYFLQSRSLKHFSLFLHLLQS